MRKPKGHPLIVDVFWRRAEGDDAFDSVEQRELRDHLLLSAAARLALDPRGGGAVLPRGAGCIVGGRVLRLHLGRRLRKGVLLMDPQTVIALWGYRTKSVSA